MMEATQMIQWDLHLHQIKPDALQNSNHCRKGQVTFWASVCHYLVASVTTDLTWDSVTAWCQGACIMFLPPTFCYQVTSVVLDKGFR